MQLENKTAAVIGLARAGVPAAKFLAAKGAKVIGYDSKARENFALTDELESLGIELQLGEHDFAGIERADIIVLSPGLKVHYEPLLSLIEKAEARGAEVIGELELASRFCPCPIIGVTGTKGKSTTTKLITEILLACGINAVAAGNTGTPLIEMLETLTPESWAVVEVSSFQLEKAPTFRPKVAVLLSLLEDHQDYHPDLAQYWETKLKIFSNQSAENNDWAVINYDDPRVAEYVKELSGPSGFFTSGKEFNDEFAAEGEIWVYWQDGQLGCAFEGEGFEPILSEDKIPLQGAHNRANIAAALGAVGAVKGWDIAGYESKIASAIQNFQSLPHRLEIVSVKDGVTYVNDSQSTIPDATIAALKSYPSPVTLLVGGRAKIEAPAYEKLMGEIRDVGARVILFGEAATMLEGVALSEGVEKSQIFVQKTLAEALNVVKMNSANGETVILSPACASFDQFTSYEHRGATFRELVGAP